MTTSAEQVLRTAHRDAAFLASRPLRVAFVASSYDTDFEPVGAQVASKCEQIARIFPVGGPVSWVLWVVDDDANHPEFAAAARRATVTTGVRVRTLSLAHRPRGGAKGRAILAGFRTALAEEPDLDALVYINLNLKVDAQLAATGIRRVVEGADAAIGTRSSRRGGKAVGAGRLGRVKSIAFNKLVTGFLPQLRGWRDTNAPMKVFAPGAARLLFENAVIPRVTLDVEWLTLLRASQARVEPFGVVWTQRPGSSPPWHLVLRSAVDVAFIRYRWGVPADLA